MKKKKDNDNNLLLRHKEIESNLSEGEEAEADLVVMPKT